MAPTDREGRLEGIIERASEALGELPDDCLDSRREDPALGPYIAAILAAREILAEASSPVERCAHGVALGDYCLPCNLTYKRAYRDHYGEEPVS